MNALLIPQGGEALAQESPVSLERIRPRCTFYDEGIYTFYTGKWCTTCAVVLTSRNRYRDILLCIEHGKEKEKARYQRTTAAVKVGGEDRLKAANGDAGVTTVKKQCPERQNLKRIFHLWLNHPDQKSQFDSLTLSSVQ